MRKPYKHNYEKGSTLALFDSFELSYWIICMGTVWAFTYHFSILSDYQVFLIFSRFSVTAWQVGKVAHTRDTHLEYRRAFSS